MNPALPAERCARAALRRGDPLVGTAAPASGFLLVESPGGWGRRALVNSRLDPEVGEAVSARAIARGLRALLIRRPGRQVDPPRRRWAVVSSRPGREQAWWGDFGADEELLSLPLDGTVGAASSEPFFLVCTHGRHDQCCAIEGRPVAAALQALRPDAVWECSHVGGDRFAANVVALPHGVYYGQVAAEDCAALMTAHDSGEVVPRLMRGRCTAPPAAQAALAHLARERGLTAVDALNPAGTIHLGGGRWQVRVRAGQQTVIVTVQAAAGPAPGLLTCQAVNPAHPPAFRVLAVTEIR